MEGPAPKKRKVSSSAKKEDSIPVEMISCYNSERIHFDGIRLSGSEPPMKSFMESDRVFPSIMLENVTLSKDHNLFWETSGNDFTELVIKKCNISFTDFLLILKNLKNLTKLVILDSSSFCKTLYSEIEIDNQNFFEETSKLSSFTIDESWVELGTKALSKWLSKMPKITEFDFSMVEKETDMFIVDCLKLWENQLTSLRLKNIISVETRNKIYELKISQLEVFQIGTGDPKLEVNANLTDERSYDKVGGNTLLKFIKKQPNLLELCIGICDVDVNFLIELSKIVPNLKILGIYNTPNLEDIKNPEVLAFFGKLTKIHFFVFCFYSLSDFLKTSNTNLTHLKFEQPLDDSETRDIRRYYDMPFDTIIRFENLRNLDVSDDYICNVDIQRIVKNLTELEVLRVRTKHILSDFAFTGKGNQYPNTEKYHTYSAKGNSKGPFYQFGRLKNLIELDIQSDDMKFTDLSLDKISKLKNLRILNLTNYKKATIFGITKIVTLCTKLEQINISGLKQKIANEIPSHFKKRVIKVIYEKPTSNWLSK